MFFSNNNNNNTSFLLLFVSSPSFKCTTLFELSSLLPKTKTVNDSPDILCCCCFVDVWMMIEVPETDLHSSLRGSRQRKENFSLHPRLNRILRTSWGLKKMMTKSVFLHESRDRHRHNNHTHNLETGQHKTRYCFFPAV